MIYTFFFCRAVLAASSDYFKVMLTTPGMSEGCQRDISLSGVTAESLSLVLDYVYTCQMTLSLKNVQSVLAAASHLRFTDVFEI